MDVTEVLKRPSVERIMEFFARRPLLDFCMQLQGALAADEGEDELQLLETAVHSSPEICEKLLSEEFVDFAAAAAAGDERLQLLVLGALTSVKSIHPLLLKLVADRSSSVGIVAARLLGRRLKEGGLPAIHDLSAELKILSEPPAKDEVRMRVLEAILIGSESSEEFFDYVKADFVSKVLDAFKGDDLLLKLNALELLERMGSFAAGRKFLVSDATCVQLLENELSNPDMRGSVALVLSSIGRVEGSKLWSTVLSLVQSYSQPDLLIGLKSLCALVAYPAGRQHVQREAGLLERLLMKIMDSSNEEVLKVACDCVAQLAGLIPVGQLITKGCNLLVTKPFPDVRAHNWRMLNKVIRIMSSEQVSDSILLAGGPVVKVLSDFVSESAYDARVAKWEFVKALMGDAHLERVVIATALGPSLTSKLIEYARGGFAWAPAQQAAVLVDRMAS